MYRFLSLPASILLTTTLLFSHQLFAENTAASAPPPSPTISSGMQPPPAPAMGLRFAPPPMPVMPAAPMPQFFQQAQPNVNQAPPRFQPMPGQNFNPDMFRRSMDAELERAKQLTQPAAPAIPSAELGAMRGQLSKLVTQQEQLMSMLQTQSQQRASLEANHQAVAKQTAEKIQQLEDELAAAKDKNSGMATSLDEAAQQAGELKSLKLKLSELEKSSVDSQEALQVKLTEAQQALQAATQKAETAQTELEQLKQSSATSGSQLLSLQQKISGSETRFTELQSAFDAAKLQLANSQITAEASTEMQAKLDAAGKEIEDKTTSLTAAEEKITLLETSAEKCQLLEQEAAEAKTQLEANQTEIADAKTQLEENQTEITDLKEQITSLNTAAEAAEKEKAAEKLKNTDTDGDGISDAIDECANTTAKTRVNDKGCEPDTDSDGLVDRMDLCPNTPSGKEIDSAGCHADATIALEGVNFQLGTAQLTDSSLSILDAMIDTLKKFSELNLEVAGHTDDNGSPARNHALSAQRAETVKRYLIEKGVEAARLEAKGYGSSEPIASNETESGQAANRRVELRRR